jgi:hypothetical protein
MSSTARLDRFYPSRDKISSPEQTHVLGRRDPISFLIEPHPAPQILKSRIGAESVEGRAHQGPGAKALPIGFFKPVHCLIFLVEAHVSQGNLGSV